MKFKLLGGSHTEDKTSYSKGDIITTDRDLAAKFGKNRFKRLGKFVDDDERVHQPVIHSAPAKNKKTAEKTAKKTAKKSSKPKENKLGLDVTEDFMVAKEAGLIVSEKEYWFTVSDKSGNVLNDKKLRKKDVPAFLEEYLTDDGDGKEGFVKGKGDRIAIEIEGEKFAGVITQVVGIEALIKFDDGDVDTYPLDELIPEGKEDGG